MAVWVKSERSYVTNRDYIEFHSAQITMTDLSSDTWATVPVDGTVVTTDTLVVTSDQGGPFEYQRVGTTWQVKSPFAQTGVIAYLGG